MHRLTPLRALHVALVGVLVWLALVLAYPVPTFPTGLAYREMEALAPEWVWAAGFAAMAAIGALGFWPMETRGIRLRWRRWALDTGPIRWHWLCLALLSITHGTVAILVLLGNPVSTGTGVYAIYAALGLFLLREHIRND